MNQRNGIARRALEGSPTPAQQRPKDSLEPVSQPTELSREANND